MYIICITFTYSVPQCGVRGRRARPLDLNLGHIANTRIAVTRTGKARQLLFPRNCARGERSGVVANREHKHTPRDQTLVMGRLIVVRENRPRCFAIRRDSEVGLVLRAEWEVAVAEVLVVG